MTRTPAAGTLLTRIRPRRVLRGAAFLWFLLVALPLLTFGSVLAVDITRIIVSSREASNVAEAAAVAGARQFRPNSWALDPTRSRQAAENLVFFSARDDVRALRSQVNGVTVQVTRPTSSYPGERVSVSLDYTIRGLVFMPLLDLLTGSDQGSTSQRYVITRTADVCIPGRYNPTGGSCTRPIP